MFDVVLTVHRRYYVEIKCQLDATDEFFIADLIALLNMFRAPLCPSSGALEYYISGCCLSYLVLGFQVVGTVWSRGLCVRFAGCSCINSPHSTQFSHLNPSITPGNHQWKGAAPLFNRRGVQMIIGVYCAELCRVLRNSPHSTHHIHTKYMLPHYQDGQIIY
jgi:hypothetical protein